MGLGNRVQESCVMKITEITCNPVTALENDDLGKSDYREIFEELRDQWSLAQLVERLNSRYSKALWSKYERGKTVITVQMRNELRAAVGLPLLPPPVADVLSTVLADGAVYQIGTGGADRALLWNQRKDPFTLEYVRSGPCNRVTRRDRTICDYWNPNWGLDSVPRVMLAEAIRDRVEI